MIPPVWLLVFTYGPYSCNPNVVTRKTANWPRVIGMSRQ